MIITTWIVYILARKGAGFPFPPKISSDVEVVESEAVSVVQHWLKKTEEEASQDIKEKMSAGCLPTHGQDVHVTRDVVKHHLSKSDLLANQSQEVLEERTRIQFIRWSHTRIFQVPSEARTDIVRERIEQVRRRCSATRAHALSPILSSTWRPGTAGADPETSAEPPDTVFDMLSNYLAGSAAMLEIHFPS
ncbi:spermatogenesis-associated protein 19, mitochondrial [Mustela nigripes]|uniref:spermatogenesis-associated protein 19, mitochondrial n=1 Tax=Mustela nigripes TaxID=77151 RepID=UPI0028167871|nr:spermatogenesis-associated protein 19, mitochondrial [Mustela nigripes]